MITEVRSEAFAAAKADEMFSGLINRLTNNRCQYLMIGTELIPET
jgi:hypothetical protein